MKKLTKNISLLAIAAYLFAFNFALAADTDVDVLNFEAEEGKNIVAQIGGNILTYVLGFAGITAVLFIVYGGFVYITSSGNEKQIDTAKKILTYAIFGLIVVILAQVIVLFVRNATTTIFN